MNPSERRAMLLFLAGLALATAFEWILRHRPEWLRPPVGAQRLDALLAESLVEPSVLPRDTPGGGVAAPAPGRRLPYDRDGRLDVNAAEREDLMLLKGVGPVLATRILERRAELTRFRSEEALLSVRGIGPKTLAKLLPQITLGVVKDTVPGDDNTQ